MSRKIIRVGETVKQQHIMPQSYLGRFTNGRNRLFTYGRNKDIREGSSGRECRERGFYEYNLGGEKSNSRFDQWFQTVEAKSGKLYDVLTCDLEISSEQALEWATFIATLFHRSRKIREQIKLPTMEAVRRDFLSDSYISEIQLRFFKSGRLYSKDELRGSVNSVARRYSENPALTHMNHIEQHCASLTSLLLRRNWFILDVAQECYLPTSDCPVLSVKIDEIGGVYLGHGFENKNVCVVLPISPKKLFVAAPRNISFASSLTEEDTQVFTKAIVQFAHRNVYADRRSQQLKELVDSSLNEVQFGVNAFV